MDHVAAVALIFDLDGTVWDSASWFAAGLSGDEPKAAATMTKRLVAGLNIVHALREVGVSREKMLRTALERLGPPPLFAGMADAIDALTARRTPLAVATSLPGTIAAPMLEAVGLTSAFKAVVHAGMCRTAKPNPASILMALRMIGQPPVKEVYYVGDRATDATAATNAGISWAWMHHGYEKPKGGSSKTTVTPAGLLRL